jgi:hypothetical protein
LRYPYVQDLLDKAAEADRALREYMKNKHMSEARRNVEKELVHEAKRQRCEALKRIQVILRIVLVILLHRQPRLCCFKETFVCDPI